MSFGFSSLGHVFASVFSDISKGAKAVESALTKVDAEEQTVEALTSLVYPPAVLAERAVFSIAGKVLATAHDLQPAAAANGMSVPFDAQEVADILALVATVKPQLAALGVTKPALPSATGALQGVVVSAPAK